jgi:hypothetical protein
MSNSFNPESLNPHAASHYNAIAPTMSWTEVFPYLTDDLLDEYQAQATAEDRAQMRESFGVRSIINEQAEKTHIVSFTLFWKHVNSADPALPPVTPRRMHQARRLGLIKRFDAWESYVEPMLLEGPEIIKNHPHINFRIHLAADLEFLVPQLAACGYEIALMRSSSERYAPGGFWRFLPLSEKGKIITFMDTDRMRFAASEIARTESMERAGLGIWRVPGYYNAEIRDNVRYRPLLGGHFGARGGWPVKKWMHAFVWHSLRGTMPTMAEIPGCGPRKINATAWPNYGCDEWWLQSVYPHLARKGVLTFLPTNARGPMIPLDIEYCTWANPRSEVVYFSAGGGCCG